MASLQVLILEDRPDDAELLLRELRRANFDVTWERVDTEVGFLAQLETHPDIILADYAVPGFDGIAALRLLQKRNLDIPFILVSGTIGEEFAVTAIREGAADYLLKDRLTRLGSVVARVLAEKRLRAEKQRADEQLQRTQTRLADILEHAAEAIIVVNRKQYVVTYNLAAEKMFGYAEKEILGQPLDLLIPEHSVEIHRRHVQAFAASTEQANPMQHRRDLSARRKDGSVFPVEVGISRLVGDGEELYTAIIVDITERKRAEEELRASEERYRFLFENNPLPMWIYDDETLAFLAVNETAILHYGYSREEFLAMTTRDIRPAEDRPHFDAYDSGEHIVPKNVGLWRHLKKDKSIIDVEITSQSLYFEGKPAKLILANDITVRRRAEEAVQESQRQMQALVTSLDDIVFELDEQGIFLNIWTNNESLLVKPKAEILGKSASEILGEEFARPFLESFKRVLASGQPEEIEYLLDVNNDLRWFLARMSPIPAPDGAGKTICMLVRDITARKRTEEKLNASETQYRRLFEAAKDGILILDAETGMITDVNPFLCEMLGYSHEAFLGTHLWELGFFKDVWANQANFLELQRKEYIRYEDLPLERADGRRFNVEFVSNVYQVNHHRVIQCNIRDITARKRAEAASVEAEGKYRNIFENAGEGMYQSTPEGRFLIANPSLARMLGYGSPEELVASITDLETQFYADPNLRAEFKKRLAEQGTLSNFEYTVYRKDGQIIWVSSNSTAVRDEKGTVLYYEGILQDITERKRAEKEILRRAEEFGALYEMTHNLSTQYELPALLQTIAGNAAKLIKSNNAAMYLYDSASDELELAVESGFPIPIGARLKMGEGMAGRVAQSRKPLMVDDYQTWESRSSVFEGLPFRAVAQVPMLYGGNLVGVLAVTELGESLRKYSDADLRLLSLFASQAASAVYNARLLEETRARAEQLTLLYDAGLTLNRVLDSRQQLEFLCQIAMKALRADTASFLRYDSTREELRLEIGLGLEPADLSRMEKHIFPAGEEHGLVGWVAQQRVPLYIPDVTTDSRWIQFESGTHSALWVPILHEQELRGVLSVTSAQINAFTPQDERLLILFANQISVAMENARLFNETRHRLAELEAVNRISTALRAAQTLDEMLPRLLDETIAILNASAGAISLLDPGRGELEQVIARGWFTQTPQRTSAEDGIAGHVLATGQPYVTREFNLDPTTSALAREQIPKAWGGVLVPIRATDEIVGTLAVSVPLPRELASSEVHLLTTIAEIAGNAIHRTRLYTQTERRLQQLESLHAIDAAIASSLDLRLTLRVLLEQVAQQLKADAAEVMLLDSFTQMLVPASQYGFHQVNVEKARVRMGEGIAGRAALERTLKQVPDLEQEKPARSQFLAAEGFVSYYSAPLIAKGLVKGVLNVFHRRHFQVDGEWLSFLGALAEQTAIAVDNAELFENLQRSNAELRLAYDTTLEGWSRALDLRDKETEGHTQRVTEISERLARALGVREEALVEVRRGGLLHDIGKMGVPDSILLKAGPLTEEEWVQMRKHPVYAYELLAPISYLRNALDIPYCHHEKWDGTGYPRGLSGEAIPFPARIFAVVDVWDAIRSDRPYRKAWTKEQAIEHIRSLSGRHFDPRVVEAFMKMIDEKEK